MSVLSFLILLSMLLTAGVLFVGVVGFSRGGAFNQKYGNLLMRTRVGFQALTLILLLIAFFLSSG
jgi:hypothetical protein